jgi:hypothetical protein
MLPEIKESILHIVSKIDNAVTLRDTGLLNKVSNYTIHNSSIYQDEDSIGMAVIAYALSKILERHLFKETDELANIYKEFSNKLKTAEKFLSNDNEKKYRDTVKQIFDLISQVDAQLPYYIERVVEKSKIKKASAMYEHGISMSRVAELVGISEWELMSYIGHTQIIDQEKDISHVKKRIEFTRKLFGVP